jgi:demethylmenaquinone methyltransferase/2-methoxy-6-polyprenyl-1,4-benzoquinol methylase
MWFLEPAEQDRTNEVLRARRPDQKMTAVGSAHPGRGHSPSTRTRRALDLCGPGVLESVRADQIAYYRARAPWYDDGYECLGEYDRGPELNAQWRRDLEQVERALLAAPLHGDCVELGAGTGYWSERVVDRVERLWALDAAPEAMHVARTRLGIRATKVQFETVDLWRWRPARVWDSAVAFFFLEHVPDEVLPGLLAALHGALRPGAPFFVAEGAAQDFSPVLETRSIEHRGFDVVERRRSTREFETAFASAGFSLRAAAEDRLVHVMATRD